MGASEVAEYGALAAILAMALATHCIRFAGYALMARVPVTPRLQRMLDALPGSVVAATVLPIVVRGGGPAILGIAIVLAVMIWRRNEFLAVLTGVGAVALMRAAGW